MANTMQGRATPVVTCSRQTMRMKALLMMSTVRHYAVSHLLLHVGVHACMHSISWRCLHAHAQAMRMPAFAGLAPSSAAFLAAFTTATAAAFTAATAAAFTAETSCWMQCETQPWQNGARRAGVGRGGQERAGHGQGLQHHSHTCLPPPYTSSVPVCRCECQHQPQPGHQQHQVGLVR